MAFKMKGWSAFTKETNLPEEEQARISQQQKDDAAAAAEKAAAAAAAAEAKMTKTTGPLKPVDKPATTQPVETVVDKDKLKREGKSGKITRRGDDASIVGEIKGRLAERAGKTETKTRKFLGRTWKKTKKYDKYGRKIGKAVEIKKGRTGETKFRQKGDITTEGPVVTTGRGGGDKPITPKVTPEVKTPEVKTPEVKTGTKKYTDLPEDQRAAARTYNIDTYGTHNPTAAAKKAGITKAELAKRYKASKTTKIEKPKKDKKDKKKLPESMIDPTTGKVYPGYTITASGKPGPV